MKDMNDFIEVNKDIFDIEEHRIKMNVPHKLNFMGLLLWILKTISSCLS